MTPNLLETKSLIKLICNATIASDHRGLSYHFDKFNRKKEFPYKFRDQHLANPIFIKKLDENLTKYLKNVTGQTQLSDITQLSQHLPEHHLTFDGLIDIFKTVIKPLDLTFRRRQEQQKNDRLKHLVRQHNSLLTISDPSDQERKAINSTQNKIKRITDSSNVTRRIARYRKHIEDGGRPTPYFFNKLKPGREANLITKMEINGHISNNISEI